MHVAFVTPFFEPAWALGGIATASAAWARALTDQGVQVSVVTTTADIGADLVVDTGVPIVQDGLSVTYFPRLRYSGNRYVSPALLGSLRKTLRSYDIVHSVGLWTFPSFASSMVADWNRIPYVISLHGMLMTWAIGHHGKRKRLFMALSERKRLIKAEAIICSSAVEMHGFEGFDLPTKATVISNVVSPPHVEVGAARKRFRARRGLENAQVLLFVGRLVRNKGAHLTLAAFAAIAPWFPQAHLVIVGPMEDHAYSDSLRDQVRELNLEKRVIFLGTLSGDDYWDAIVGADLFVLNSYSENFGMAPAEALALGVPALLDQVGIAELVSQYRVGMVTSLNVERDR